MKGGGRRKKQPAGKSNRSRRTLLEKDGAAISCHGMEEALREAYEQLNTTLNALPGLLFEVDGQGRIYDYRAPKTKLLYASPKKFLNKKLSQVLPKEVSRVIMEAIGEAAKRGHHAGVTYSLKTPAGHRWFELSIAAKGDPKMPESRFIALARDITERKRAEKILKDSENRLRAIFEGARDAVLIADTESGILVDANKEAETLLNRPREEIIGMHQSQLHPQEKIDKYKKMFADHVRSGGSPPISAEIITAEGKRVPVEINASVIEVGGKNLIQGTFRDTTDRQRAAKMKDSIYRISEAAHSAQNFEELFRSIHHIVGELMPAKNFYIALYDPDSQVLSFPYFIDEYDEKPASKKLGKGLTEHVLRTGEPLLASPEVFEQLVKKDEVELIGSPSIDWLGVPLKTEDKTIGVLVVQSYAAGVRYGEEEKDIFRFVSNQVAMAIERKRAQEALREERDKAQMYLDVAGTIFVAIDADKKVSLINKKGCEILGWKEEEIVGKNWFDHFLPQRIKDKVKTAFAKLIAGEIESVEYFENAVLTKSGEEKIIAWHNTVLKNEAGNITGILSSGEDITERKRTEEALHESEEQLRQSQKMEAVGRLAGGVAHDLNNLLTGITGYNDLLLRKIDDGDPLHKYIVEIQKVTDRATSLIRQLLAFSRKQVLQLKVLNLNKTVSEMEKMLRRVIGEDIELITALEPKLGYVKADPGQMEQVIMNLAVNARDAMPQGGKLIIETANFDLDEEYTRLHVDVPPGRYVMLAMSDTGDGMDEETRSHIFEPFFTTKEVGKGTGLGLSTVYGIVKQIGGHIWVYSEPGKGTTFKVYLLRTKKDGKPSKPSTSPSNLQEGSETVLVVEDEEVVRELVEEILQKCGYTVLVAHHGDEALAICRQHKGPIHLMVTDVVMPQMSGRKLAEKLSLLRPEIKVLYISGYTDDFVVYREELDSGTAFLQKPFTLETLAGKVRQVLDTPQKKSAVKSQS